MNTSVLKPSIMNVDVTFLHSKIPEDAISHTLTNMRNYVYPDMYNVIGNVEIINSLWESFTKIEPFCNNCSTRKHIDKFINSKKDIIAGKVFDPPMLNFLGDNISFINGRNRFSNLRDSGVKFMPILIDKSSLEQFIRSGIVTEIDLTKIAKKDVAKLKRKGINLTIFTKRTGGTRKMKKSRKV